MACMMFGCGQRHKGMGLWYSSYEVTRFHTKSFHHYLSRTFSGIELIGSFAESRSGSGSYLGFKIGLSYSRPRSRRAPFVQTVLEQLSQDSETLDFGAFVINLFPSQLSCDSDNTDKRCFRSQLRDTSRMTNMFPRF